MKRCRTIRALGLVVITTLLCLCAALSAVAQTLPETESHIVQELDKSQQGLNSWKCTGIESEEVTQRGREAMESAIADGRKALEKATGRKQPPVDGTRRVGYSFDASNVFFAAKKGDTALYAERKLRNAPKPYAPPDSTIETLKEIRKTGTITFTDAKSSHEVTSETMGDLNRQLQRNQKGQSFLQGINEGFSVHSIGMTPRDAILKHGFCFVGEETDPKYGKVLVFRGRNPRNPRAKEDDVIFHLAPQFGHRVVYSAELDADGTVKRDHRITSLVNVKGHWLPAESQDAEYLKPRDVAKPDHLRTLRFAHHTVNDVPDAILKVELKPGDYEWNEDSNTTYKVGANSERIFQDDTAALAAARPRKILPSWLYLASITTLLVLTILAYIRWKRKQ